MKSVLAIDKRTHPPSMPRLLLLVFFILAVSIGASGYYYYSNQRKDIKQSSAEELSAIAELKVNGIVSWRKARLGDADVIFGGPWTAARIQQFLNDPSSVALQQEILTWMESRRKNYQYNSAFLFDALGNIRLSANPEDERIHPLTIDLVKQALSTRHAILSDIRESNQGKDLDIDLIAPLVLGKGSEKILVGALLFRIDPRTILYPLIQTWPTPSKSGETLLVRREGKDVLFLNDLRHRRNASPALRIPLTKLEVPAVQAALGQEGTVEGVDYRGVKVLAVKRVIPDSSWAMVSKVDIDEVYRPLYERARWVIAFVGILILSAALCLGFIWRQQTARFYLKGYQAELARRLTEQRMKESEARYRSLFENMLEGYAYCRMIFEHDQPQDFIYLDVNRAFEQLTGLKNVVGKRVTEVIPGIRRTTPELFEAYGRVASTGKPETFEIYVEGLGIWFSISVYSPQRDCFVAVFENITERKRADTALRHSEAQFRTAFDDAPVGMCLTTPEGRLLRVNQALCQFLGYTEPDLLARGFDEVTHPDDRENSLEGLKRVLSGKAESADFEKRYLRRDGQPIWAFVRTFLLRDANHQPVHFITHILDINERKRSEEEVRRLNIELEQRVLDRTTRLEAANQELEAFAYSVSHDLRAPLRAMDGFSRILLSDYSSQLAFEAKRYLQLVRDNARQMGHLIDDLLAFSRLSRQNLNKQVVRPQDLVNQSIEDLRPEQDGRKVEIKVGSLPACHADSPLLKQVFMNLLSNALKFTRKRELAGIEIGCQSRNGGATYYVKDNGVGFDMQYAQKLFGVFQRLHRLEEYEGTGVGLAIVQRIISRHGGRVWAEAALDQGATFYFTLEGETSHE